MSTFIKPNELYQAYKKWVCERPNLVTDMERVLSWSLYLVAGKVKSSPVTSELVYTLSSFYTLFNDYILREAAGKEVIYNNFRGKIKLMLTLTYFSEVLIERVMKRYWGNKAKWSLVTILQILKCISSLILLFKFKELPVCHPPIPMLQRSKYIKEKLAEEVDNGTFTLKRSGRVIRKVDGSPPLAFRDWLPVAVDTVPSSTNFNRNLLYAETIYILKPIIHLMAMKIVGRDSWKQWLVALTLDTVSLKLYGQNTKELSHDSNIEISWRKMTLIFYLLRSPMYERHTRKAFEGFLTSMVKIIPMARFISNPILHNVNYWQALYFYMWSS